MSKDPTFSANTKEPTRSFKFEQYRAEWDARAWTLDPRNFPLHIDVETVATCDLKCGSNASNPKGFCQVWTHEHIRKLGQGKPMAQHLLRGMMDLETFTRLAYRAAELGSKAIKLNYRGEPSLHPQIVDMVKLCKHAGFVDIMMNTNGNGGARKNPELFVELIKAGITSLNFSVDSSYRDTYNKQRVGGNWDILLNSVKSAVLARDMGLGVEDLRVRASAVRTALNKVEIDTGKLREFWKDHIGVDWVSVSECYFPAGSNHEWVAVDWEQVLPTEYTCIDPFRRMVITWDGKHTLPCCQGFTLAVDAGYAIDKHEIYIEECWESNEFTELRRKHQEQTWDIEEPMCVDCPLTKRAVKKPIKISWKV